MPLLEQLSTIVGDAFEAAGLDRSHGAVVVSQRPDLAQFQCNGALAAAKTAGRNPRQLAGEIADRLSGHEALEAVSVAGPGFINLTLTGEALAAHVEALAEDDRRGVVAVAEPLNVVIDFGGPNVAKAMHVGHLRSTIIGDSLQRLFRFAGHDVTSDIHLGDWGTQMGMLIEEVRIHRPDLPYFDPDDEGPYPSESPVDLDDLQALYPQATERCGSDGAAAERARLATLELQRGRPGYRALWQHFVDVSVEAQRRDFALLGVSFDLWYGESTVHDRIAAMIDHIRHHGHVVISDGALIVPLDHDGNDEEMPPLLLAKSDGGYLYHTTDLATIDQRVRELHADLILYVVDLRQRLHFEQVFRAARLTGVAPEQVELEHIGFGTMNGPDGKPFKTREGGVLKLRDLIEMVTEAAQRRLDEAEMAAEYPESERADIARMVGLAALKYGDLINHRTSNYVFDLDRFVAFVGKTGPYLQYSAVRIKSILRNATERGVDSGAVMVASGEADRDLMLALTRLPDVIARAVQFRAPNHVAEHAYDLATWFNRFYEACHILDEPNPVRQAGWLRLVEVTLAQLELVLHLLGIEVPERM